jgi:hypothetical protein
LDHERIGAWGTATARPRPHARRHRPACALRRVTGASERCRSPRADASDRTSCRSCSTASTPTGTPASPFIPGYDACRGREPSPHTCALPGPDAWAFFEARRGFAPAWRNEVIPAPSSGPGRISVEHGSGRC